MKKQVQEYLTFYSPEYIFIPFDETEKLKLRRDKVVLNNMILGYYNDETPIISPVSGKILGIKKSNYLDGERNSLVIENDFIDKRNKLNPFLDISNIKKTEINETLKKHGLYKKIDSKTTLVVESKYEKNDLCDTVINYESYEEILEAIDELLQVYNMKYCYICIPNEDDISNFAFNKYVNAFPNICIVNSKKKIKEDKCIFYSIEELLAVYRAIHLDYLLDNTMLTINDEKNTVIVRVKLYTSLSELLKTLKFSVKGKEIYVNDNKITEKDFIIDRNVRKVIIK